MTSVRKNNQKGQSENYLPFSNTFHIFSSLLDAWLDPLTIIMTLISLSIKRGDIKILVQQAGKC